MKRFAFLEPGRKPISVLAGAALLLIGSASMAGAAGGPALPRSSTTAAPAVAAQTVGGACRAGYDAESQTFTPPDSTTADNPAAATVTITKPCPGAVVGRFTSETATTPGTGFLDIDMRATCIGKGGFTNPCAVGQQVFALPGNTIFQFNSGFFGMANAVDLVWPGLKRGVWRFEVLPGGDGFSILGNRMFTVMAFNGG
jgi:hypothetical protein